MLCTASFTPIIRKNCFWLRADDGNQARPVVVRRISNIATCMCAVVVVLYTSETFHCQWQ